VMDFFHHFFACIVRDDSNMKMRERSRTVLRTVRQRAVRARLHGPAKDGKREIQVARARLQNHLGSAKESLAITMLQGFDFSYFNLSVLFLTIF
jgi:hypothetical protein